MYGLLSHQKHKYSAITFFQYSKLLFLHLFPNLLSSLSTFKLPTYLPFSLNQCPRQLDPLPTNLPCVSLPTHHRYCALLPFLWFSSLTPQNSINYSNLDPNNINNFRPISNLPFLSKILKKIVATQVHEHLTGNNIYEQFQSGFCAQHRNSPVKITNDLLLADDSGLLAILMLLNLTADFTQSPITSFSIDQLLQVLLRQHPHGSSHTSLAVQLVQLHTCSSQSNQKI